VVEIIASFLVVLWLLGLFAVFDIGVYVLFGVAVLMILVRLVRRANAQQNV
jgi:hypothetical protein